MSDPYEHREMTYEECDRVMGELSHLLSRPYHDRRVVFELMAARIEHMTRVPR